MVIKILIKTESKFSSRKIENSIIIFIEEEAEDEENTLFWMISDCICLAKKHEYACITSVEIKDKAE